MKLEIHYDTTNDGHPGYTKKEKLWLTHATDFANKLVEKHATNLTIDVVPQAQDPGMYTIYILGLNAIDIYTPLDLSRKVIWHRGSELPHPDIISKRIAKYMQRER